MPVAEAAETAFDEKQISLPPAFLASPEAFADAIKVYFEVTGEEAAVLIAPAGFERRIAVWWGAERLTLSLWRTMISGKPVKEFGNLRVVHHRDSPDLVLLVHSAVGLDVNAENHEDARRL